MSHSKLLTKLSSYGLSGDLFGWINSFLSNRTQAVRIDGFISKILNILSGVPQGSVLGPTLFLLYINDIIDCFGDLSVSSKLYADDLKLYCSYTTVDSSCDLSEALIRLSAWADRWQLEINSKNVMY